MMFNYSRNISSSLVKRKIVTKNRYFDSSLRQQQQQQQDVVSRFAEFSTRVQKQQQIPPNHGGGGGGGGGTGRIPMYIWGSAGFMIGTIGFVYYRYLDEVPLTHRKRWIATSPEWERKMGDEEYQKLKKQFRNQILPNSHRASQTVQRVGARIARASQKFAKEHNITTIPLNTPYTYTVVRSEMANAFVLPNNHVFVMTGLFDYVKDEDDLAAVLGHEMAHNLARHAGEKISGSVVTNLLARLSLLIDPSGVMLAILLPATSILRELPHSRTQEIEADHIGIYLAAEACYDPRAAQRVFAAMMKPPPGSNTKSTAPPEFLSTHPSHEHRIEEFGKWMNGAMETYQGGMTDMGRCHTIRKEMKKARQIAAQQQQQREQQQHKRLQ